MRNRRTAFLAGIATLALVAGTGLVAAQETSQGSKSTAQPHAGGSTMKSEPGGKMGQNTQSGKMGEAEGRGHAQSQGMQKGKMGENESSSKAESKTKAETKADKSSEHMNKSAAEKDAGPNAKETDRKARETEHGKKADKEKFGESETRKGRMDQDKAAQGERKTPGASTSEERREGGPKNAQSRDERLHGLQGNASGVTFNEQQRTRIRETVINARGAPRVGSVDFDLAVGTAIPRDRVQIVPVPEYLVEIEPRWRGFRYFIYEDELVIVDPVDMRIVAVVPV